MMTASRTPVRPMASNGVYQSTLDTVGVMRNVTPRTRKSLPVVTVFTVAVMFVEYHQ